MTRPIPPPPPQPDEAAREFIRETIASAEAEGRAERAFYIVRDALYEAWREVDKLRARHRPLESRAERPGDE